MGVILAHLSVSFQSLFGFKTTPDFFMGNVGVDLFFVISGFIMVYSSEAIFGTPGASGTFLRRRLLRIIPLYWAATAFQCYLYYRFGGPPTSAPTLHNVIASLFFLPIPGQGEQVVPILMVGWTLNFEMLFYVVFALAVTQLRMTAVVFTTAVLGSLVILGLVAGPHLWIYLRPLTNPLILEFLMGAWIAVALRAGFVIKPGVAWLMIVAGLCLVYFSPSKGEQDLFRISTWGAGFALVVAAAALRRYEISPRNIFVQLGEASYSMYLTHWFVLMTPPAIIVAIFKPPYHPVIYSMVIVCAVITVAVVVHKFFELPVTSLLRHRAIARLTPARAAETGGHR